MLHNKFQDHRTSGSGEDFGNILAWRLSWACDKDHFNTNYVPSSNGGST